MSALYTAIAYATLAGATIPLGGLVACVERIRPDWLEAEFRHSVIAFGGGALFAAIALVLVPQGVERLPLIAVVASFLSGGLVFMWMDRRLARHGGSAAQLIAMLLDYLPEAMAVGAAFTSGETTGPLLALLIALQNFPEAFNAFRELRAGTDLSASAILLIFTAFVLLGPLAAIIGIQFLAPNPAVLGGIMLFSSGGILYLIFEDIAPQAKLERHWAPPLGAVAGFLFGIIGEMVIHG